MIGRRQAIAGAAALIGGAVLSTSVKAGLASGSSADSAPSRMERLSRTIALTRLPVEFDGRRFSGTGYEWLLQRGRESEAFLLGEEHGIAENPMIAAQLFTELARSRYRHAVLEISPPMSDVMERIARNGGRQALREALLHPDTRVPFFGLREEADWLAAVFAAVPAPTRAIWGIDYEVMADRHLIGELQAQPKPRSAAVALAALKAASDSSWSRYNSTHDPRSLFSFAGDPELVRALRVVWPNADTRSRLLMETLEKTLEINSLFVAGKGYESNLLRSQFMRSNLLRWWSTKSPADRVFMKMGGAHLTRGLNVSDVFDVGTLVPELVAQNGGKSFSVMVLPGPGAETANLDPTTFRYVPGHRNQYGKDMGLFVDGVIAGGFTIFPTAPLRPIASSASDDIPPALYRVIHGFDAVLVMTGSRASSNL